MGVYEIYSPKLVDVSPNWVRHPPGMGELVHPPAGDTPLPTDVYSPTRRCLLPLPAGVYLPHPRGFSPPPAGVSPPHPPVFTSHQAGQNYTGTTVAISIFIMVGVERTTSECFVGFR